MNKRRVIYEGKAKIIYEGPEPGTVIQHFKDDATAFNAEKRAVISGKGVLNNRISAHLMTRLESIGIPTHFIRSINMREQLVRQVEIIPLEVVVRNIAAGSLCKRFDLTEGAILPRPLVEFYYKKDELGDPLVNDDHIITFGFSPESGCGWLISRSKLAGCGASLASCIWFLLMKYLPIIAACGTQKAIPSWTRIASGRIWAA
jgi:phosphoribosylaminoimidazole-succinocarboxamide synthase